MSRVASSSSLAAGQPPHAAGLTGIDDPSGSFPQAAAGAASERSQSPARSLRPAVVMGALGLVALGAVGAMLVIRAPTAPVDVPASPPVLQGAATSGSPLAGPAAGAPTPVGSSTGPARNPPVVAAAAPSRVATASGSTGTLARSNAGAAAAPASRVAAPAAAPVAAPAAAPAAVPVAAPVCDECGVVAAVREHRVAGQGTGVGAVAGGVLGGVAGHQFGRGGGNDVMTVLGAVGGAVAGHQTEKQVRATTSHLVDVKMEDGSLRTIDIGATPAPGVGTRVRVENGHLSARAD